MIMSNRGANCTLCLPGVHKRHLKVCLGRLNTDSFVQENSKLAELTAQRVICGDCLCQMSVLLRECFPWVQVAAELVQGVPSDVKTFGYAQQMQCYL